MPYATTFLFLFTKTTLCTLFIATGHDGAVKVTFHDIHNMYNAQSNLYRPLYDIAWKFLAMLGNHEKHKTAGNIQSV
jgi:hypothetical protein